MVSSVFASNDGLIARVMQIEVNSDDVLVKILNTLLFINEREEKHIKNLENSLATRKNNNKT